MSRIGRNTRKVHAQPEHARITAAVVTYAPEDSGYFKDRIKVIDLSLRSLVKNADLPLDLMVFDNASRSEVAEHLLALQEEGLIRYLVRSAVNVGLVGAYRFIANAAPGEIVAYANDDVFYFPGWLGPQVRVLDELPDVGCVSGFYLRGTHPRSIELARSKGLDVREAPAPDAWIDEFCRDAGYANPEAYFKAQEWQGWTEREDFLASRGNVDAYVGGVCWQAVFRRDRLRELLPSDNPKDHGIRSYDGYFHGELTRRGFLRLSTKERLTRHIGNVITPEYVALARESGIRTRATPPHPSENLWNPLRKAHRRLLKAIRS